MARPRSRFFIPAAASSTRARQASASCCGSWSRLTGFPITSTLMGLGAYPASRRQWLGMLGMHGTYEANMAMHDCDVMVCIGARFDDRITGRTRRLFARIRPRSTSTSIRRPSTRTSMVDIPIIGDVGHVLEDMVRIWRSSSQKADKAAHEGVVEQQIDISGASRNSLGLSPNEDIIMPQYAIQRLYELTKEPQDLHHHRGRAAPDVGGPVLRLSKSRTAG